MDTVRISGKNSQVSSGAVEVVPAKPRRGGLPFKLLTTAVLVLTLVSVAAPTASLAPIAIGSEAFDARFGHIQGACCTDDAIYLTQMKCLYKFDWSGKLLKKQSVISHTGDICFWKGEIYTSVSVYEGPNKGKGMIQVFDQELNMVRETLLDRVWWDAAGELTPAAAPLSSGALETYAIRLRIALKRGKISKEAGAATFDGITAAADQKQRQQETTSNRQAT